MKMNAIIVHAIVTFLSGHSLPLTFDSQAHDIGQWFFQNSLFDSHPQLETRMRLRIPIVGIGAPAAVFLQNVAEKLHSQLILPEHHAVANAVGAAAGTIMITEEVIVYPRLTVDGLEIIGYTVQTGDSREGFEKADEALARATELVRERALGAALRSGADHPEVVVTQHSDGLDTFRIRAKALGKPRLMRGGG